MACTTGGTSVALAIVNSIVGTFENGVVPTLEAVGKLSPAVATAITQYVDTAVSVVNQVDADIKSGVGTPAKIAAVLQTAVTAYDSVATLIPGSSALALYVNVANLGIQSLLGVLGAESAAQTPTVAAAAHSISGRAVVTDGSPIHPGFFDNMKLNSASKTMLKVQDQVHKLLAA